ncbi:MAG TPA: hypothetical protein VGL78_18755 [Solirubrobacteraceae bacterium]|jgi:hypothetical protein
MNVAEIRRIADGEGETVAALWDQQSRTGIDGGPWFACSCTRGAEQR